MNKKKKKFHFTTPKRKLRSFFILLQFSFFVRIFSLGKSENKEFFFLKKENENIKVINK